MSIDTADRYGETLRRLLRRAERLSEAATAVGLRSVKTLASRSSALLVWVTCCDHFFPGSCPARLRRLSADGLWGLLALLRRRVAIAMINPFWPWRPPLARVRRVVALTCLFSAERLARHVPWSAGLASRDPGASWRSD